MTIVISLLTGAVFGVAVGYCLCALMTANKSDK